MNDTPAAVEIRIDVLVLPEEMASSSTAIATSFQHELARLATGSPVTGVDAGALDCGSCELVPGMSGPEVGVEIARAVFEGLRR